MNLSCQLGTAIGSSPGSQDPGLTFISNGCQLHNSYWQQYNNIFIYKLIYIQIYI